MKENGLSQAEFAKTIGMSQGIVNNYRTGKREPTLDGLIVVCKASDIGADYLFGLED